MNAFEREVHAIVSQQIAETKASAERCSEQIGLVAERYGVGPEETALTFMRLSGEVARQVMPEMMHGAPPAPPSASERLPRQRPRSHHHEE